MKAITNPKSTIGNNERKFYDTLRDVFVGAKVEGKSGYINLIRIKERYYQAFLLKLQNYVQTQVKEFPDFKEELYDKLYTFFRRYFSETGSIHTAFTPVQENVLDRIYTEGDVALYWKTHDLYYVKSDRLWKSTDVEVDGFKFHFDTTKVEHGKAFEKREVIYTLGTVREDGVISFIVSYTEKNRVTKIDEILREIRKKGFTKITEEILEKAFSAFEKQDLVDYFINKNANRFLKDQFSLWLIQYLIDLKRVTNGTGIFTQKRLKQLEVLKNIAFKIIDFISVFEDEQRKIWEKPKFVLNSNYVITLDRIKDLCGEDFLENYVVPEVLSNEEQLKEWKDLLGVQVMKRSDLVKQNTLNGTDWKKLPVDTKNFSEEFRWKLIEKVCEKNPLDEALDGWLIKSENWQALNTIKDKFKGKIQTIYIDPPFNKEKDAEYYYHVKYKDSTWITMLENRVSLARDLLKDTGSIFVRCDYNGNMYVRLLLNQIFGKENFRNEIVVNRTQEFFKFAKGLNKFMVDIDTLFFWGKSERTQFNEIRIRREVDTWWEPFLPGEPNDEEDRYRIIQGKKFVAPEGRKWGLKQEQIEELEKENRIRIDNGKIKYAPLWTTLKNNWTDVPGYSRNWEFLTENSEMLLKRVIESTSHEGDLVMDFFLGSGTTTAVAHKLKRKWVGVEMGEHFYKIVLPRMKKVLFGEQSGISKEVNWSGGGFFKYYELEQYEQTLSKTKYGDYSPFTKNSSDDIEPTYIFLKDEKMLRAVDAASKKGDVQVDLSNLYDNIDVAETISNLSGKYIKGLRRDKVILEDGEVIDLNNPDWKLVKCLIWW